MSPCLLSNEKRPDDTRVVFEDLSHLESRVTGISKPINFLDKNF